VKQDVRLRPLLPSGEPQLFARVLEDVARDIVLRSVSGADPAQYPSLLRYSDLYTPPAPPPDPPGLTLGKPYLALRSALQDGKLVYLPREGFCDGIVLNTPYVGLRAATHDGKLVYLISDQKLAADDTLTLDKPYIGLRAATHDGKLVYLVKGGDCNETTGPIRFCGCDVCCTLEGTVQLPTTADPTVWSDPIDVTLTCGATFEVWNGEYYCVNDEVEDDSVLVDQGITTYSGKSGTYYDAMIPATVSYRTEIWSSEEFSYEGTTYKLLYIATSFDWVDDDVEYYSCQSSIVLQVLTDKGWCISAIATGIPSGYDVSGLPDPDYITAVVTGDPESECPPGYSYNGGDGSCGGYGLLTTYPTQDEEFNFICPVVYDVEVIYAPSTKIFKVMLADLCE
jgi:hypothetical protein